jgi:predicted small lipoprotein YifL
MKKLLSVLFALAIFFPLAASVLAQPDDGAKAQATETQTTKKKKHHKKKHKHILGAKGNGSMKRVTQA